jgi:hypothetical protein
VVLPHTSPGRLSCLDMSIGFPSMWREWPHGGHAFKNLLVLDPREHRLRPPNLHVRVHLHTASWSVSGVCRTESAAGWRPSGLPCG